MLAFLADILGFVVLVVTLATGALGFSPSAFIRAASSAEAQSAAIIIAFLAGVSEMLGQSVILVVNRIPLYRFLASLGFTGATYALTVITWSLAVFAIAPLTTVGAVGLYEFAAVSGLLGLAFAPRLFGVFSIAPYIGPALNNILEAWSMALAIFALHVGLAMPIGAAVICGGAGFLASYIFRTFIGHLLAQPLGRLRRIIAGSALEKSPSRIIEDVMARIEKEVRR